MSSSKKIIINTAVLYLKLFISIIVAFFTSRLVLNALGEVDYGINSLVAGVIGMLAFLQTTISSASIRYLAFSLGSNDPQLFQKTIGLCAQQQFMIMVAPRKTHTRWSIPKSTQFPLPRPM